MRFQLTAVATALLGSLAQSGAFVHAQNAGPEDAALVAGEHRAMVPHRLLALLHAPEVQHELKLSPGQVAKLERRFAQVDGPWFRNRIQPPEVQLPELDRLEAEMRTWLVKNFSFGQRRRLLQIEWQALGGRMLLRNDFARALELTPEQQQEFAAAAAKTDASLKELPQEEQPRAEAIAAAQRTENEAVNAILTEDQRQRFSEVVGKPFDVRKLTRAFPLAPELVPVATWYNSEPLTLASLRGKVTLVHFYAFQCSNCKANFAIYRRWHEQLAARGVVVIGIQTPETASERDPAAVEKAAKETQLEFPILLDAEAANWKAWGNTMWPTVYVVDKRGYLRHWWQGELNWQGATADKTIEQVVEAALAEPDPE
ncbi:MAG: redoxin domain-containing protein [Pirellulales bacterium]|nr:redoxin domain-containing protein [Pirellulales bacterium]